MKKLVALLIALIVLVVSVSVAQAGESGSFSDFFNFDFSSLLDEIMAALMSLKDILPEWLHSVVDFFIQIINIIIG
jgi:hypothetical protein